MTLIIVCPTLHELGHGGIARGRVPVREVVLLPLGGVARMGKLPVKPTRDLVSGRKGERTMYRVIKIIANGLSGVIVILLLAACASRPQSVGPGGTAWGTGAFSSNGERIYFTATSERSTAITYTGGPASSGGMMGGGRLACASCHGPDGRGGVHTMTGMQTMTATDIRWSVLQNMFDAEQFRLAVTKGQDHNGTQLNTDMPRWNIGDDDLADLIAYLKTLP